MRLLKENLFLQFSVISFVVLAVIAVVVVAVLSNVIRTHAIDMLIEEAIADSTGRLLGAITPADLEVPMTGERYNSFHEFVQKSIVSGRTARVKLWAKDGTVIYSNDPASVGEKFPDNENLLIALSGENAAEIKIPEDPENERERFLGTLIEVYTPIIFPGTTEPQGAFEIYQYYEPTAHLISDMQRGILVSTGFAFVVFYGALVGIVWRGWRTIIRQREERRRAEEDKEKVQSQLIQSQKMDAVGMLAGGVAHDFNNLLTAIIGYSDFTLRKLSDDDPLQKDVKEIKRAGERAASLTRQLLAFSHKQVLQPQVLDLNSVVANIVKMLKRLIGEDVEIVTALAPRLKQVNADPGQIEQVIMNLAVNARDAMPQGGRLTIRTENVTLDEYDHKIIPEARPGEFVRLSVEDTGIGMDKETMQHIFEPFFTTKETERGTGLGLSVVYGIVGQHQGWINVHSEPEQGSTFKLYLPAVSAGPKEETKEKVLLTELKGSGERILLVEDEPEVRQFTATVLGENGYVVFEAASAEEALNIFNKEKGDFHLIFSDVVLTAKSGLELVGQLLSQKPELPVLMSSGYADQKSHWQAMRQRGFGFLQKPYTMTTLLQAVGEAIEQAKSS